MPRSDDDGKEFAFTGGGTPLDVRVEPGLYDPATGTRAGVPTNPDAPTRELSASRARAERWFECAHKIAHHLRANPGCFVESAALAGGMNPRTYHRHMAGTSEDDLAFQNIVLPALHEHAAALLREAKADIDSAEGGSSAWSSWHRWLLPKRHPKLFGEQPQEHNVAVGGTVTHEHELRGKGADELVALMLGADAVKRGKDGEDE